MDKLRNKIFYIILGILSVSFLSFLLVFNVQNYEKQKDVIIKSMSFNGLLKRNFPNENNRDIRFMDANVITVRLDNNDNIVEIINHSNDEVDNEKLKEIASSILKSDDLESEHIGLIYFEKYSYSYRKGLSLVIVDNFIVQRNLKEVLKNTFIFFIVLEIIFIGIAKVIANWISHPVEEA